MNNLVIELNKLGWRVEIKEVLNDYLMLRTLNDEVKQFETSNIVTYQIKAMIDDKTVIINVEDITDIDKIISMIKECASILDNKDEDYLAKKSIVDDRNKFVELNIDEIRNDMLDLYKLKSKYSNILNIDTIFERSIKNISILNSDEISLNQSSDFKYIYISVSVKELDNVSESSDYYLFSEYNKNDLINFFDKICQDAINRLNETTVKSNRYNVIINNNAMYSILKSFKDMFLAKNINKGLSILSDKYKKQIFSELITIVEEPLNNNLEGTYKVLFDSEGTPCQNKIIIDSGQFINKLYDNKESIKEGLLSTGNSDGVNNMYLLPGELSFNELVKKLDSGIIITKLSGLHSGINTITGDMSLEAKGYMVLEGNITKPLNSILLSANIFEILNNVICVGNDLKFYSTNVGSPSILCENIMIVGEK